jgi:hypothetical protein
VVLTRIATTLGCGIALATSATAQQPTVVVELADDQDSRGAYVSIQGLLADGNFLQAMRSGFPLYLEYQVELRENRSNWFDRGSVEAWWEYVVLYDPVRERFVVEDADGQEELSGEAALMRRLEQVYLVALTPDRSGTFYYAATVTARTLSDSDVDEVFDWLKGEDGATAVKRHGLLTRTARRLLVQVAPLPRLSESGRSEPFVWP